MLQILTHRRGRTGGEGSNYDNLDTMCVSWLYLMAAACDYDRADHFSQFQLHSNSRGSSRSSKGVIMTEPTIFLNSAQGGSITIMQCQSKFRTNMKWWAVEMVRWSERRFH